MNKLSVFLHGDALPTFEVELSDEQAAALNARFGVLTESANPEKKDGLLYMPGTVPAKFVLAGPSLKPVP